MSQRVQRGDRRERQTARWGRDRIATNYAKLPRCADSDAMWERSLERFERDHPGVMRDRLLSMMLMNSRFGKFGVLE
jgi:hypothetical protein